MYVAILAVLGSALQDGHASAPPGNDDQAGAVAGSAQEDQTAVPLENGDFESNPDSSGSVPVPGWLVPQPLVGAGYRPRISHDHPYQGSACVELYSDPAHWTPMPGVGSLVQELDAVPLRDQTVRLSGWIRTSDEGAGQLWLRVDDPSKPPGFFTQAPAEAIRSSNWTRIEIVGSVAHDADGIHFGANLVGSGAVFLDDVRLEIVESIGHEPPSPISSRGMDNLVAAARLLDGLRFFHPSDSCATAPWERVGIALVAEAEPAPDARALARALAQFAAPLAPSVMIFPTGDDAGRERAREEVAARLEPHRPVALIQWNHYGVGDRDVGFPEQESVYRSWRSAVEDADLSIYPNPGSSIELELGGGVSAIVPTTVYVDESHRSLPSSTAGSDSYQHEGGDRGRSAVAKSTSHSSAKNAVPGKPDGFRASANDRTTRLAAILYSWSILREFYPNFDLASCPDRDRWLRESLSRAALDPDREAFLWTLRTMLACLGDGHAEAHAFYPERAGKLPLTWRWIEGRLVITEVAGTIAFGAERAPADVSVPGGAHRTGRTDESGASLDRDTFEAADRIRIGDVVLAIDGESVSSVLDSLGSFVSSPTERWRRLRAIERLATGSVGTSLQLLIERGQEQIEAKLPLLPHEEVDLALPSARLEPIRALADGIHYVDLSRLDDTRLEQFLSQTPEAEGIIFDLRGDPDLISPGFLGRWVDALVLSPEWRVPLRHLPVSADWIRSEASLEPEIRSTRWALDPISPRSNARMAILMDERSISRAETYLAVAQRGLGAILVGSHSAGTLGNSNRARLPGGLRITWTGMDVYEGEGAPGEPNRRLSGSGIAPTIEVLPTLAGVREGRDEVLERALEAIAN